MSDCNHNWIIVSIMNKIKQYFIKKINQSLLKNYLLRHYMKSPPWEKKKENTLRWHPQILIFLGHLCNSETIIKTLHFRHETDLIKYLVSNSGHPDSSGKSASRDLRQQPSHIVCVSPRQVFICLFIIIKIIYNYLNYNYQNLKLSDQSFSRHVSILKVN